MWRNDQVVSVQLVSIVYLLGLGWGCQFGGKDKKRYYLNRGNLEEMDQRKLL